MQRSPPADRHGAPDKESFRRPWVIRADPSTLTTESKVLNLSEVKRQMTSDAEPLSAWRDQLVPQLRIQQDAKANGSEASAFSRIEDRRQRVHRLPARLHASRTVTVVKQQDGSRPQLALDATHDHVYSGLCGIEHGPVPRAHLVARLPHDTR